MLAVWALAFWPWLFAPTFGFVAIARDIEADLLWDSPSRASFGKVGSIMKRLRVPIDRHADGQLTEVLRKIVLVVPYRRPCCSLVATVIEWMQFLLRCIRPVVAQTRSTDARL